MSWNRYDRHVCRDLVTGLSFNRYYTRDLTGTAELHAGLRLTWYRARAVSVTTLLLWMIIILKLLTYDVATKSGFLSKLQS